jgi:hypothetical protein
MEGRGRERESLAKLEIPKRERKLQCDAVPSKKAKQLSSGRISAPLILGLLLAQHTDAFFQVATPMKHLKHLPLKIKLTCRRKEPGMQCNGSHVTLEF